MVDEVDYHSQIGNALGVLIDGLSPFVERVFAAKLPSGISWTAILERKDLNDGKRGSIYSPRDLSLMLRALTERLGELGYPFDNELPRQGRNYASELRTVRNEWAHNQEFTAQSTYRAIDSAELLLRMIGSDAEAERLTPLKHAVLPTPPVPTSPAPGEGQPTADTSTTTGSHGLEPETAPRTDATTGAATVIISSRPFLSYAMAHCHIPVVDKIVIDNAGPEARGASLEVDVVSTSGSQGGPKIVMVDLGERQSTTLRTIDLMLDPERMLAVQEQRPAQIRATLRDAEGTVLGQSVTDVQLLASNQWIAEPLQLGLELLAAHVQPNASIIETLLHETSEIAKRDTGDSSLAAYQTDSPERIDQLVAAAYDAIRSRDIRYAEPPASWGLVGQKIRTPSEVLEGHLGTCLDTTVTLAAVLEQLGINSTLWLLNGHIFLGYWRIERSLDAVAQTDAIDAINLVDLDLIGLVETTGMTGGDTSMAFAEAQRLPRARHLANGADAVLGVTDVRQARESHIYPLPSRSIGLNGEPGVTLYQPAAARAIEPYYAAPVASSPNVEMAPPRVSQWKNSLLDLSLRNKLINYTERAGFALSIPGGAVARLEDMVNAGTSITLLPSDAVPRVEQARGIRFGRDVPEQEREVLLADKKSAFIDITGGTYTSKLRYLTYKAKTVVEETGANNLYLAFGMLRWKLDNRELRSPLVLVPVNLTSTSRGTSYRLSIDEAGASTPNYCLLEKLRVTFGLSVPGLANPVEDASGIDLAAAFMAMREAVVKAGLPFLVDDSVNLSILQFAKFRLWKDLDENWEALTQNSLVSHLVTSPLEPYTDPITEAPAFDLDAMGAECPVPADSSQLDAIADAVGGRTFVLEGPPGTGKSQTITNLLARSLAEGKRVLFVAEKRAALNVVKDRLKAVGLGDFSLDLHDKGARPAAVRAQIKAALDLRRQTDLQALTANREASESSRRGLSRYADRLHETNAAGLSLYSARTRELAIDPDVAALEIPPAFVGSATPDAVQGVRDILRRLPEVADVARPDATHPWRFIDERAGEQLDAASIHTAAQEFDAAFEALRTSSIGADVLERASNPGQLKQWASIAGAPRYPVDTIDVLANDAWGAYVSSLEQQLTAVGTAGPSWADRVHPEVIARDLPEIHAAALAADASGFFGRKKRRRAVLEQFEPDLTVANTSVDLKHLSQLTGELAASYAQVTAMRDAALKLPLPLVDATWNPLISAEAESLSTALLWIRWLGSTLRKTGSAHTDDVRRFYTATTAGSETAALTRMATAWENLTTTTHAQAELINEWSDERGFLATWWMTRGQRNVATQQPITLQRWLDLIRHVEPLRQNGLGNARDAILTGRMPADDATLAFDKGVAAASIVERQQASGLDEFDVAAHGKTIERFTSATRAIRDELPQALPTKVLGLRRFDTAATSGQIGGLRRQLDRQRGGMSVRALIEHYGAVITQIMPCTLMSPESVARFFPADARLFDIVVFDEASQIRVADAVGAMGRATSVVVVGDSKQMPPTSFAEASAAIDDDAEPTPETVVDEESILTECVQARVPSKWLSWHYRSQDESLITFSNHYYYENRLSSFPAPTHHTSGAADGRGISLVRVNGTFQREGRGKALRTNQVEAEAIVDDVQRRFAASPDASPSVGIVTFNAQQRDLIENMLRDCEDERIAHALDEVDGLFVKNLENVQGDERDCILFSIAFSANKNGMLPLNFGPLSRAGGERRLNVAITRARRQVVLYASFDPGELRTEQTASVGLKHLRAYLELAQTGVDSASDGAFRQPFADQHRDDIANELRYAGYAVQTDVGLSDFRVDLSIADSADPQESLVAVLLDGPGWRARRTVADRDGLPVDVLEGLMHWPAVERVWLPEWLHHRDETLKRIGDAFEQAKVEPAEPIPALDPVASPVAAAPEPFDEASVETRPTPVQAAAAPLVSSYVAATVGSTAPVASADFAASNSLVVDFTPWEPGVLGTIDVLGQPGRVQAAIRDAVAVEGPIHSVRLAKLVGGAFGLGRVEQSRAASILRHVPRDIHRESDEPFFWPSNTTPADWRTARRSPIGSPRNLDHVSLIEIANAFAIVAEASAGVESDDIKREALAMFGGQRMTQPIGARLDDALTFALSSGRLERSTSGILVARKP